MFVAVEIAADEEGFDGVDEIVELETAAVVALGCANIAYLDLVHCSHFDSYNHSYFCYLQHLSAVVRVACNIRKFRRFTLIEDQLRLKGQRESGDLLIFFFSTLG